MLQVVPMTPRLREVLEGTRLVELKKFLALLPDLKLKAPPKSECIEVLVRSLTGNNLRELWERLKPLERSAATEAAYDDECRYKEAIFRAKYQRAPAIEKEREYPYDRDPTLLRLLLHPGHYGDWFIPRDLAEEIRSFVPRPPPPRLGSMEQIPEQAPRKRRWNNFGIGTESGEPPLVQRLTERAAIQDLRTTLRLIDQEKISVSAATLRPSGGSMTLLSGLLREGDFFDLTAKCRKWEPEIGPMKAFAWPLLVHAARLAAVRGGKLSLTPLGRSALTEPPAELLRRIWNAWLDTEIIDEFSRIEIIKGQKRGRKAFTPVAERRLAIAAALAECPIGRWIDATDFSRFMLAAGYQFEVTKDPSSLYIGDAKYGSLGYEESSGWNVLQERYLFCLLFEYAATLGMIDIAYQHPSNARDDIGDLWGTDDITFLSRYDGLRYFRLTPLGAFILGLREKYDPLPAETRVSLSVLPKRQIRVDQGEFSPDELLLMESFADQESDGLWSLNEQKAVAAVEKGARVSEFRALLSACDRQPLPETVEAFLMAVEQRGAACVFKGRRVLVECATSQIAEAITRDAQAGALCRRVGDRELIIPVEKEEAFRKAINNMGLGMPRV